MIVVYVAQAMPGEAEMSPLDTLRRRQAHAGLSTALENLVELISVIPSELRSSGFVQRELPPHVFREGTGEAGMLVPGSYLYMQRASRTVGGFYTILHALHTNSYNLMCLAKDPGRGGELKAMANELHFFAAQAYEFYSGQLA